MTSYDLAQLLFQELGYVDSAGFAHSSQDVVESTMWRDVRRVPHVDGIYRINNIPIAYFSHLDDADSTVLKDLHRRVWNQSKVPLLYVVLPQEIRVYNGYAEPAETVDDLDHKSRLLRHLQQLTDVERARQAIRQQLVDQRYDRLHLDTGAFWVTKDGRRINRHNRADQRLLRDMSQLRRRLLRMGLSNNIAYALLGRSILVRYLEDRGALVRERILKLTNGRVSSYREALYDLETTYVLFENLSQRFNGDLFPVLNVERQTVQQEHLNLLGSFLDGQDLETGQMSFWPYDFEYIPIELISSIYDTFLNINERRQAGTYYTPLPLVDFMLDETMPLETTHSDMTVLDPACGSGIFLVRTYQRLVNAWQQRHSERPTAQQLGEFLRRNIFGVDIQPEATLIAAFSLYLAMLDYLDKQAIFDQDFRFPPLQGTNLITSDFFAPEVKQMFTEHKFDRVVGNPPWKKGSLTPQAAQYLQSRGYTVGEKQIAQAFLASAAEFCANDGEVALLAPAKSTILVTSRTHETFRRQFFERYDVRAVVNFAILRHELFADIKHPAVALFYHPTLPRPGHRIAYGTPKPSPLSQQLGAIVLDATETKYLDQEELLAYPALWKVALWGTPRDATLIKRLQALPTLQEQAENLGWKIAEGIQIGGGDENPAPWLQGMPLLSTRKFQRYILDMEACAPIQAKVFHRPRTPDIVRGPLTLVRQSPTKRKCAAAFSIHNVAYRDKISGVAGRHGQEDLLKWLAAYLNSPLAQYYHFLTSTSWAVERGTVIQEEYLRMPFLVPDGDDPRLKQTLAHFDQIVALMQQTALLDAVTCQDAIRQHEAAIAELVFDLYELTTTERQLVWDMIDYGIDFFYWSKRKRRKPVGSRSVQPPDTTTLRAYADTFVETVTALLRYQGQTLNAVVYQDSAPLSVVAFELVTANEAQETKVVQGASALQDTLARLDRLLLEQRAPALYTRRHVRVYDGPKFYLVRPSERRFWTRSQAYFDADNAMIEWLSVSYFQE